jgi:hypothetical protein
LAHVTKTIAAATPGTTSERLFIDGGHHIVG